MKDNSPAAPTVEITHYKKFMNDKKMTDEMVGSAEDMKCEKCHHEHIKGQKCSKCDCMA